MTQGELVDRLLQAFPERDAWPRMKGESYGPRWDDLCRGHRVERVLFAVTCTRAVEQCFVDGKYDLLVLHHPMRPVDPLPHVILHTPLDCGVGGLNDLWRDALGLKNAKHIVDNLGWYGKLRVPLSAYELRQRVQAFAGGIDGQLKGRNGMVKTVAVCAGLGGWIAEEAQATGADAFVTGELTQPTPILAFPVVIEVGHTRSERIGVEAIQRALPELQVDVAPLGDDRFGKEIYDVNRGAL